MLKLNGAFFTTQIPAGLDGRRGVQGASQQVRQYDITPPPIFAAGGDRWPYFMPQVFPYRVFQMLTMVLGVTPPPVFSMARALAPGHPRWVHRRHQPGFLAPVSIIYPSCPLG